MDEHVVVIHTDGGCRPNPGPGGWGAVLRHREHVREMCGGESGQHQQQQDGTDCADHGAEALTGSVVVHLYTDSTYVRNGITKWVLGWERSGWKTAAKQPVKNVDLWQRLQAACALHRVEWFWVKGHAGIADNELADELATRAVSDRYLGQVQGRGVRRRRVILRLGGLGGQCGWGGLLFCRGGVGGEPGFAEDVKAQVAA